MLLDDQSAVNCTVSVGRVGFRCCLRAGGQWLDDLTCAFREDVTKRGGARAMGGRLRAWNECLAIAAEGNDTLADALADAGQLCFAAPGSTTEAQEGLRVFLLALGALAFLACVGLLIWIITSIVREAGTCNRALGFRTPLIRRCVEGPARGRLAFLPRGGEDGGGEHAALR